MASAEDGQFRMKATGESAVRGLNSILSEREKTRRILIISTVLLSIASAIIAVFAPAGKESIAYIFAGVLFIFALGSIGATVFTFKLPGVEVSTTPGETKSK